MMFWEFRVLKEVPSRRDGRRRFSPRPTFLIHHSVAFSQPRVPLALPCCLFATLPFHNIPAKKASDLHVTSTLASL
jgi:hypothetical protein